MISYSCQCSLALGFNECWVRFLLTLNAYKQAGFKSLHKSLNTHKQYDVHVQFDKENILLLRMP